MRGNEWIDEAKDNAGSVCAKETVNGSFVPLCFLPCTILLPNRRDDTIRDAITGDVGREMRVRSTGEPNSLRTRLETACWAGKFFFRAVWKVDVIIMPVSFNSHDWMTCFLRRAQVVFWRPAECGVFWRGPADFAAQLCCDCFFYICCVFNSTLSLIKN